MKVLVKKWDGQTVDGWVLGQCEETGLYNLVLSDGSYGSYEIPAESEVKEEVEKIEVNIDKVYLEYDYELLGVNKNSNVYFIPDSEGVLNPERTKQGIKNYFILRYNMKQTFKTKLPKVKELLRELELYGLYISPTYRRNDLIRIAEYIAFDS